MHYKALVRWHLKAKLSVSNVKFQEVDRSDSFSDHLLKNLALGTWKTWKLSVYNLIFGLFNHFHLLVAARARGPGLNL